jgi:sugar lactone lactonase YvrE
VIAVDPVTGAQTVISQAGNFSSSFGIALDAAGRILVADFSAGLGFQGAVIGMDALTGAQTIISQGGNFRAPWASP